MLIMGDFVLISNLIYFDVVVLTPLGQESVSRKLNFHPRTHINIRTFLSISAPHSSHLFLLCAAFWKRNKRNKHTHAYPLLLYKNSLVIGHSISTAFTTHSLTQQWSINMSVFGYWDPEHTGALGLWNCGTRMSYLSWRRSKCKTSESLKKPRPRRSCLASSATPT